MTIAMTDYPLVKAKEQLSRLIDKVLAGEEVTNTRHGKPVVDLRPRSATGRGRPPGALIDEIAARAKLLPPLKKRAAEIVREMRGRGAVTVYLDTSVIIALIVEEPSSKTGTVFATRQIE